TNGRIGGRGRLCDHHYFALTLGMEFLKDVGDELRALSDEASKHAVVQEAAERAIERLGKMREQYAKTLREGDGEVPSMEMFRSQDLLRPFLLACNHSNAAAKLISMALS
ncbi:unnamed protein product, partial [Chrysoparadoxa australica]